MRRGIDTGARPAPGAVRDGDVLVVDDMPEKHLMYRACLADLRRTIVTVTSGEEALQLLLEREFAVILLDVKMPGMSGLEVATLIRQRSTSRHTPIIFIVPPDDETPTERAYALDAIDTVVTPIVPGVLRAKVKMLVDLYEMRAELGRSYTLLEQRVADRTRELELSAERLRAEVHERKQAEERLTILVQELAHRVKNLLSVFQSITGSTLTGARTVDEGRNILIGRLQSLGHAHELLIEASWRGADLRDTVIAELAGFTERVQVKGPPVPLSPTAVQTFALIVHELSTNAAKYGALSNADGEVEVEWSLTHKGGAGQSLRFTWAEHGGPPVLPASHEGFGLALINAVGSNGDSRPAIDFAPGGFSCRLCVPLETITPNRYDRTSPHVAERGPAPRTAGEHAVAEPRRANS